MAQRSGASILQRFEALPIIIVFVLLLVLFMYPAPEVFLAPYIYTTFLSTLPPLILLAIGLTFVIGAGEIDLCFPSIIAFSGFVFAVLFKEYNLGWIAVDRRPRLRDPGRLHQRRHHRQGRHPVLHDHARHPVLLGRHGDRALGRQVLCAARRRAELGVAMDRRTPIRFRVDAAWLSELPIQALWTAIIVGFLWFILNRHRFGEHTLFIGDSNDVSRVVGINVDREKIKIFTLMGFLAACAAIMLTLENKNFFGNQGQGYLLTAIASVLIGGTSIFGGRATIIGTVFGCFIIGMVEAGLVAAGLTGAWVRTVQGLIFLISIIFYMYVDEPQRRRALFANLRSFGRFGGDQRLPNEGRGSPTEAARIGKGETNMRLANLLLAGVAAVGLAAAAAPASADPIGKGLVMYMQMGGNRRRRRHPRPSDRARRRPPPPSAST